MPKLTDLMDVKNANASIENAIRFFNDSRMKEEKISLNTGICSDAELCKLANEAIGSSFNYERLLKDAEKYD